MGCHSMRPPRGCVKIIGTWSWVNRRPVVVMLGKWIPSLYIFEEGGRRVEREVIVIGLCGYRTLEGVTRLGSGVCVRTVRCPRMVGACSLIPVHVQICKRFSV